MYIDKQQLLDEIEKQWVGTPHGAVSAKLKEIYNVVKSGAFDTDNHLHGVFTCPHCKETRDQYAWNEATRDVYGEDIGEIQTKEGDTFVCPSCRAESDRGEIVAISGASENGIDRIALRPEVQWFAEQMELTLRKHDHKGGWRDCDYDYLIGRLEEETEELRALEGDSDVKVAEIIQESTDIANFAMMIADNTKRVGGNEG